MPPKKNQSTKGEKKKSHVQKMPARGAYPAGSMYAGQGAYNLAAFRKELTKTAKTVGKQVLDAGKKELKSQALTLMTGAGRYRGRGAYDVSNALVTDSALVSVPPMKFRARNDETSSIEITAKEFVSDVFIPNGNFGCTAYAINPGLGSLLPKLAQLACNFEAYRIEAMLAMYEPTITDPNSATGQVGTIIMTFANNPSLPAFADKRSVMDYNGSAATAVTNRSVVGAECDPRKRAGGDEMYIRTGPVPYGQDIKTFDFLQLQVAIAGCPSTLYNQPCGELYIEYRVTLFNPKLVSALGNAILHDEYTVQRSGLGTGANPWNNTSLYCYRTQQSNLGTSFTPSATGATFTLPTNFTGALRVQIIVQTTATVAGATLFPFVITATGNIVGISDQYTYATANTPVGLSQSTVLTVGSSGGQVITISDYFITTANAGVNNALIITGSTGTTSTVVTNVEIFQYHAEGLYNGSGVVNMVSVSSGAVVAANALN